MTMLGFDVETVNGAIFTMQFARSVAEAELFEVTPDTALGCFLDYLSRYGTERSLNILWAHNLEFDFGSTFTSAFDLLWGTPVRSGTLETRLANGTRVELAYHNSDNPYHRLRIGDLEWLLLDTHAFFKGSLAKVCEDLGLPVRKLEPPEYIGDRRPTPLERPAFEAYALIDAQAAYALGLYIAERHREFEIGPSFSGPHMASMIFRRRFLGSDLARTLPRRSLTLSDDVLRVRKKLRKTLLVQSDPAIPFCDDEFGPEGLLEASLLACHGGKVGLHVAAGVYDDVAEIDIVSAYPHAMRCLPPVTSGHWERVRELVPGHSAIYRVRGKVAGSCPYGVFYPIPGGSVIRSGPFDTWVTGWELETALSEIILSEVVDGYLWVPSPDAASPFADYVDLMFARKQATPKGDPRYATYKLLMNSLYGKLIQVTVRTVSPGSEEEAVGGSLFNPYWAAQITGHTRAHIHRLEHQYQALHSSTDSIITRSSNITTGTDLGDLEVQSRGRWLVLRPRLHFLVEDDGTVKKKALHAFQGKSAENLLACVLSNRNSYCADHMMRPREASKNHKVPFKMELVTRRLLIDRDVVERVAQEWLDHQAARPIPFPKPDRTLRDEPEA